MHEQLESRELLATLTWTGDVDANWNTDAAGNTNWDTDTLPAAGDTLVFDGTSPVLSSVNDTPAGTDYLMQFTGASAQTVSGNEIELSGGSFISAEASTDIDLPLSVTGTATFSALGTSQLNINGVVSGSGGINVADPGTVVLNANNTYDRSIDINDGTLVLGVTNALDANADITVAAGATLDLAGNDQVIDYLDFQGTLDGGGATLNASFFGIDSEMVNIQDVSLAGTAAFSVEVDSATTHTEVTPSGSVDISGASLSLNIAYSPTAGDQIQVINAPVTGNFLSLPEGAELCDDNENAFSVSYVGGVTLTYEPSPSTIACLTTTVNDGLGFEWEIGNDGEISDGSDDAFDGAYVHIGFPEFNQATLETGGREFVIGPAQIGNVEVVRKVFIPSDRGFARFLEIVTNTSGSTENYTVEVESNLGSDSGTLLVDSSSGDNLFDLSDDWLITDDGDASGDPTLIHVVAGGSEDPTSVYAENGEDDVDVSYDLTLAPGATQIVMHFSGQFPNQLTARVAAHRIVNSLRGALEGISATELSQIVNFDFSGPTTPVPLSFERSIPLGSLIQSVDVVNDVVFTPGDESKFSVDLTTAGQQLAVLVSPSASLQPTIEIRDSSNGLIGSSTAANSGDSASISSVPLGIGVYEITVTGASNSTGAFSMNASLNVHLEEDQSDGANDSFATAESIDNSFISLSGSSQRGAAAGSLGGPLYTIDENGTLLRSTTRTGQTASQVLITLPGETIQDGYAIAADPTTSTLYASVGIDRLDDVSVLVTIDPNTGVATQLGIMGIRIDDLTFDASGALFGVSGDRNDLEGGVFSIDKTDGSLSLIETLPTHDGYALRYDGNTDELVAVSGRNQFGLSLRIPASSTGYQGQRYSGDAFERPRAMVYDAGNSRLLLVDSEQELFEIDAATGVSSRIGDNLDESKGLAFVSGTLYSLSIFGNEIHEISPIDGSTISSVSLNPGGNDRGFGLATDPIDDTLYAIIAINNRRDARQLVSINPGTGDVTDIGNTGLRINELAFDAAGNLYGTTGSGSSIGGSLVAIDKTDATASILERFNYDGSSGLAFDSSSGEIKFAVRNGDFPSGLLLSIPTAALTSNSTVLPLSSPITDSAKSIAYDAGSDEILLVTSRELSRIDPATGSINSTLGIDELKGLAFVDDGGPRLYGLSPDGELQEFNPATGAEISSVDVMFNGNSISRGNGMATDPTSNTLFAVISPINSSSPRELVTIDPATGIATSVGNLGGKLSGLAFDNSGQLYGVSGSSSHTDFSLYSIDKTNAEISFVQKIFDEGGGIAIGFDSNSGDFYVATGSHEGVMVIDGSALPTPSSQVFSGAFRGEPEGAITDGAGDQIAISENAIVIGDDFGTTSSLDYVAAGIAVGEAPEAADTFKFSLVAGETVTIGLDGLSLGASLEIYSPSNVLTATGVVADNLSRVVSDLAITESGEWVASISDQTGGFYSLVVTRDAAFDTENNNSIADSQPLALDTALGFAPPRLDFEIGTPALGDSTPVDPVDIDLFGPTGYLWDLEDDGSIGDGSSDAYDTGMELIGFPGFSAGFAEEAGRERVFGPATDGDLEITRKVYVPDNQNFARFLEVITNTGASTVNHTVEVDTNLGSDSGTVIVDTSSGDTSFGTDDNWIITDDNGGDPTMIHVTSGGGGQTSTAFATQGDDDVQYSYDLTLAPGETKIVMHFAAQNPDPATARALAEQLAVLAGGALDGMTPSEVAQIVNFSDSGSDTAGDYYSVDLTMGQTLLLETDTLDGGELDPQLELYDPSGILIASDDNSAADARNAMLSHFATEAGAYTVVISGRQSSGEYTLSRTIIDPPPTLVTVESNDLVIRDVDGTIANDYLITTDGTTVTIQDLSGNGIGLIGVTGTGAPSSTVQVDLTEWTGGIDIESGGGDDTITVDVTGAPTFDRVVSADGGSGDDTLNVSNSASASDANVNVGVDSVTGLLATDVSHTAVESLGLTSGTGADTFSFADLAGSPTTDLTTVNSSGGDGEDTFQVTASSVVAISVAGENPASQPGDTLELQTTTGPIVLATATNGSFTDSGIQPISWTGIDSFTLNSTSVASGDLIVDATGINDRIIFSLHGRGTVLTRINNQFFGPHQISGKIVANGKGGSDNITVAGNVPYSVHFIGGEGRDNLVGGTRDDTLDGGGGNDTLLSGAGNNLLLGGSGNDILSARDGNDTLIGQDGNDRLDGSSGSDVLIGDDLGDPSALGNDKMFGGSGDDLLVGGSGNDRASGGFGNDVIIGNGGNDLLQGNQGEDLLVGGVGEDRIYGNQNIDRLVDGSAQNEADDTQLLALLAEWSGPSTGASRLFASLGTASSDGEQDLVSGGGAMDLLLLGAEDGTISDDDQPF
jgi:autotransporter-associated beta strand protein